MFCACGQVTNSLFLGYKIGAVEPNSQGCCDIRQCHRVEKHFARHLAYRKPFINITSITSALIISTLGSYILLSTPTTLFPHQRLMVSFAVQISSILKFPLFSMICSLIHTSICRFPGITLKLPVVMSSILCLWPNPVFVLFHHLTWPLSFFGRGYHGLLGFSETTRSMPRSLLSFTWSLNFEYFEHLALFKLGFLF